MDLGLRGKTCLVTGASTGIGRATVLTLAAEGARVVATARSPEALSSLVEEIEGGLEPILITGDLSQPDGPLSLSTETLARVGQVDVLVNNAGGSRPLTGSGNDAAWAEAFALNFTAARALTEHLAPAMVARGWGRVVNVTGAIVAKSLNAASPAKAALESWSKAAAATFAPHGVTVNCVAPGRINSVQILKKLHPTEESRRRYIESNIPAGRFGEAAEAAALVAFLASTRASYITGVTVPVDGGAMRLAF